MGHWFTFVASGLGVNARMAAVCVRRADSATIAGMSSRLSLLVELSAQLGREVDLDTLLHRACDRIREVLGCDRVTVWLVDAESQSLVGRVAQQTELADLRLQVGQGLAGHVAATGESLRVHDASRDARFQSATDRATGYLTRSVVAVPIRDAPDHPLRGVLQLLNHASGEFSCDDVKYAEAISVQLARVFQLTTLRARNAEAPGLTLQGPFNHIVGCSPALLAIYPLIQRAAAHDATVLLRGETGTGKGLFASAIHVNSARGAKPFVTLDCTLLSPTLAESQLFGHERGAFTGADRRVAGKLELAAGGTLFLDEIGELSLELQAKLLRVLQEKRFERVGGQETLTADIRIIAATHRDLEAAVRDGTFRQDLYYRLRVVEVCIPALRARGPAEVNRLAEHFLSRFCVRYSRPGLAFSPRVNAQLREHTWPGNVRELEHWVESAVVLSDGPLIEGVTPFASTEQSPLRAGTEAESNESSITLPLNLTLAEVESRYVDALLRLHHGNKTEVAKRLNVGRNTLQRRIVSPKLDK